jgi:alpha-mannosidase
VRTVPANVNFQELTRHKAPFFVSGGHNVFLETIKRGDDDDFSSSASSSTSVVLRLYEAYGGHGQVKLNIGSHINVVRASITNLLEDQGSDVEVIPTSGAEKEGSSGYLNLNFRGFEVKTVKLVIGSELRG